MLLSMIALFAAVTLPADQPPLELAGVGVIERIGRRVDLDLRFTAENGYPVALHEFFTKGKPVILNLVYYSCPMLCNLVLNGQTAAMRDIPWTAGEEFEVITISIDPSETFDLAQRKKAAYLMHYGRPAAGWHFLTDHQGNVRKLAEQVGFRYRYDERTRQYAHAAVIMILTPDGRVARYLYGVKFSPRDLRLALAEASEGRFRFSIEQVLLYCFHYDPQARGYVLFATNLMRAGGILTVVLLGVLLLRLRRKDGNRGVCRHAASQEGSAGAEDAGPTGLTPISKRTF